jgi:hypothetical protein
MYITGRSAFCTVQMKIFIQSTLLKTQKLNIRIHYDRKTLIFIATYTLHMCVKFCCISKLCLLKFASKELYIPSLGEDRDDVSTRTFPKAKAHCSLVYRRKLYKNQ